MNYLCIKCGQEKPQEEFYRIRQTIAKGECRECERRRSREKNKKYYEKYRPTRARYLASERGKKVNYEAHKRYKASERGAKRHKELTEKSKLKIENRFKLAQRTAKRRDKLWSLSLEEYSSIVLPGICAYCSEAIPNKAAALDRKDSSLGYSIDNVVACCAKCNRFKLDYLSYEEMVAVTALLKQMRSK